MDKNPISSRLDKELPGAVLEVRRFGRSSLQSIWVEAQSIQKVARLLRDSEEFKMDWLENLSVVEFEDVLVVTYFIRSTVEPFYRFVLRISAVPKSPTEEIEFPSICSIWPMGGPMEQEAAELFGIRFVNEEGHSEVGFSKLLPDEWKFFPLRKKYEFPIECFGISHSQPSVNVEESAHEP